MQSSDVELFQLSLKPAAMDKIVYTLINVGVNIVV